jgi:AbrB family looped-hinge helix DNA binding protein
VQIGKTYLTGMNAKTKMSAKGQIVIPKDVRERMGLAIGDAFEVITRGDEVILRREPKRKRLTFEEATAQVRKAINYQGPRLPVEALSWHPIADGDDY